MAIPEPPADLNRSERKSFRILAQRVADRGIDPIARLSLIAEAVRLEARLIGLREAEKTAKTAMKMPAARAVNTATAELRRITVEIYRGAAKVETAVPIAVQAAANISDADDAWRRRIWHGDKSLSEAEMIRRYGPPTWAALLYRTAEEAIGVNRLLEKNRHRAIPEGEIAAMYREIGMPYAPADGGGDSHAD